MIQKLTKFFKLIKENKQTRILSVITIALLFIFTIGYSLSAFTNSSNKKVANIKVNDLSFNITTNSGESDDRILHLQAGKTEQFDIILTNLNSLDVKYELRYELCNNQDCTSTSKDIPNSINLNLDINSQDNISDIINDKKYLKVISTNISNNDYYIKLNLNAGYIWNELELANQIGQGKFYSNSNISKVIAYVDGKEVSNFPTTCNYNATLTGYNNNNEVQLPNSSVICNKISNHWNIDLEKYVDTIKINFISQENFITKIIASNDEPTDSQDNTIWIKTSSAVSKYIFTKQVTATLNAYGGISLVYTNIENITNDTPSIIYDGEENGIYDLYKINLTGCLISNGSTTSYVDAYIRKGSNWIQFSKSRLYLYKAGNEYKDITGGWSIGVHEVVDGLGTVTKKENYVQLITGNNSGDIYKDDCPFATNNKVNLESYHKIYAEFTNISSNVFALLLKVSNSRGLGSTNQAAVTLTKGSAGTNQTLVLGIPDGLTSPKYVVVGIYTSDNFPDTSARIINIWAE